MNLALFMNFLSSVRNNKEIFRKKKTWILQSFGSEKRRKN